MLQCTQQGDALTVHLCGEIDHCAAEGLRNEIEMQTARHHAMRTPPPLSQVTFMDSSGVGMSNGRNNTMHARGGSVAACGLQPPIDRLFHLAGLHRIIAITETEGRETHE